MLAEKLNVPSVFFVAVFKPFVPTVTLAFSVCSCSGCFLNSRRSEAIFNHIIFRFERLHNRRFSDLQVHISVLLHQLLQIVVVPSASLPLESKATVLPSVNTALLFCLQISREILYSYHFLHKLLGYTGNFLCADHDWLLLL